MTVILTEPFDTLTNWTGSALSIVAGGHTGNAMQIGTGSNTATYAIASGSLSDTYTVDLWFKPTSTAVLRVLLQYRHSAGAVLATVQVTATGVLQVQNGGTAGTVIGSTAAGAIVANTFYRLTLTLVRHATAGRITAALNTTQFANGTALNTVNGSTGSADRLDLRCVSGSGNTLFDDLVLTNTGSLVPTVKEYTGSVFVDAPVRVYTGSVFVDALAVRTWNGSVFV